MKFKIAVTAAAIVTLLTGTAFASPTLSRNSRGSDVLTLQKKLYLIGYDITELDGIYGNETERAVAAFQHDNKISVKRLKKKKGEDFPTSKSLRRTLIQATRRRSLLTAEVLSAARKASRLSQRLKLLWASPTSSAARHLRALIVRV